MNTTTEVNETQPRDMSVEAYNTIYNSIPPIGFISRKKRVRAYLKATKTAQQLIDEQFMSENNALFILSLLVRKYPRFQKAAMMTALNLATIERHIITPVGFKFANEMRCNINMLPID